MLDAEAEHLGHADVQVFEIEGQVGTGAAPAVLAYLLHRIGDRLDGRQIEILAKATPKRDYYCQSRRVNRLFELSLSEVGLALCGASSKSDQTRIAELVAEHGRDGFLAAWLRDRGVEWAVDLIPNLTNFVERTEPARSIAPDHIHPDDSQEKETLP